MFQPLGDQYWIRDCLQFLYVYMWTVSRLTEASVRHKCLFYYVSFFLNMATILKISVLFASQCVCSFIFLIFLSSVLWNFVFPLDFHRSIKTNHVEKESTENRLQYRKKNKDEEVLRKSIDTIKKIRHDKWDFLMSRKPLSIKRMNIELLHLFCTVCLCVHSLIYKLFLWN